jgi:hypothetical protein
MKLFLRFISLFLCALLSGCASYNLINPPNLKNNKFEFLEMNKLRKIYCYYDNTQLLLSSQNGYFNGSEELSSLIFANIYFSMDSLLSIATNQRFNSNLKNLLFMSPNDLFIEYSIIESGRNTFAIDRGDMNGIEAGYIMKHRINIIQGNGKLLASYIIEEKIGYQCHLGDHSEIPYSWILAKARMQTAKDIVSKALNDFFKKEKSIDTKYIASIDSLPKRNNFIYNYLLSKSKTLDSIAYTFENLGYVLGEYAFLDKSIFKLQSARKVLNYGRYPLHFYASDILRNSAMVVNTELSISKNDMLSYNDIIEKAKITHNQIIQNREKAYSDLKAQRLENLMMALQITTEALKATNDILIQHSPESSAITNGTNTTKKDGNSPEGIACGKEAQRIYEGSQEYITWRKSLNDISAPQLRYGEIAKGKNADILLQHCNAYLSENEKTMLKTVRDNCYQNAKNMNGNTIQQ